MLGRNGRAESAEEAHPVGDRSERESEDPEPAEQHVERIARRVRDAEKGGRRDQLAAVPDVDRPARTPRIDGQRRGTHGEGREDAVRGTLRLSEAPRAAHSGGS